MTLVERGLLGEPCSGELDVAREFRPAKYGLSKELGAVESGISSEPHAMEDSVPGELRSLEARVVNVRYSGGGVAQWF